MSKQSNAGPRGPLSQYAPGFWSELITVGYSKSAAKKQLLLLAHLSCWLDDEDLNVDVLATERVAPFFYARRARGCSNLLTLRALRPLLAHLGRLGVIGEPDAPPPVDDVEVVVAGFRTYLVRERGLVEGTVQMYVRVARALLGEHRDVVRADRVGLNVRDVTAFVSRVGERQSLSSARQTVSALRALLRFLQLEGLTEVALDHAVLSVAGRGARLPRGIAMSEVARLLASCDRRRAKGRRDYAILMLLSRFGLRAGEVVAMELDDIDWRAGELVVHGKGRREDRLPLPDDVGEALSAYLRRGRPRSDSRRLFLGCFAPHAGFASSGAVTGVLADACVRSGVPYASPHRLRHSVATEMLRAGAPLTEIGQILRHRSAAVTAIYAAVDHTQLRTLARAWPGGAA